MDVAKRVDRVVELLEEESWNTSGRSAARVAEGIDRSGLAQILLQSQYESREGFTGLAAALGMSTKEICSELAQVRSALGSIEHALANPLQVAAQERFRRGVHALDRGWGDEAVTELTAAIELDPYHPQSQALLGVALGMLNRVPESAEAFRRANRYASPDQPQVAAGAALLAANAYLEAGAQDRAVELLTTAFDQHPSCPELGVALWRLTDDLNALDRAVAVAPEYRILSADVQPNDTVSKLRTQLAGFRQITGSPIPSAASGPEEHDERPHHDGALFEAVRAGSLTKVLNAPLVAAEKKTHRIDAARAAVKSNEQQLSNVRIPKSVGVGGDVTAAVETTMTTVFLGAMLAAGLAAVGTFVAGVVRFDDPDAGGGLGNPLVLWFLSVGLGFVAYWAHEFWVDSRYSSGSARRARAAKQSEHERAVSHQESLLAALNTSALELERAEADPPPSREELAEWSASIRSVNTVARGVPTRLQPWAPTGVG